MKKRLQLKTKLLLCALVTAGVVPVVIASYYHNISAFMQDSERIAASAADLDLLRGQFERHLFNGMAIAALIAVCLFFAVYMLISSYKERMIAQELEYHNLLTLALKDLYTDVYEFDVTRGVPTGEDTRRHFESMDISEGEDFSNAMKTVTLTQIKEEFREGFFAIFAQENVLREFEKGVRQLNYDCMVAAETGYKWVRMRARLFYYNSDHSVHMIVFSQDINEEKERERKLLRMAETDPLTGLYNKAATKRYIDAALSRDEPGVFSAFLIVDIDHFKAVNDTLGHSAGDRVIKDFAQKLKRQFRDVDITGRVGGDEFIVLVHDIPGMDWLDKKLKKLSRSLRWDVSGRRRTDETDLDACTVTASIGVACYPRFGADFDTLYRNADAALYNVKEQGRDGYAVFVC